jgi:hypothetical protein
MRASLKLGDDSAEAVIEKEKAYAPAASVRPVVSRDQLKNIFISLSVVFSLAFLALYALSAHKYESRKRLALEAEKLASKCIENPSRDCSSLDESLLSVITRSRLSSSRVNYSDSLEKKSAKGVLSDTEKRLTVSLYGPCKAYIGDVMGRNPDEMTSDYVNQESGVVGISYIRSTDGTRWKYECKSDGANIFWRTIDAFGPNQGAGRWRNEDSRPLSLYL